MLKGTKLTVAQTPSGLADAPGLHNTAFLQPHVVSMKTKTFLKHLKNPDGSTVDSDDSEDSEEEEEEEEDNIADDTVLYMQSQNNNFPREFPTLANDAPHSIPWANEALDVTEPAAVNLWLGDHRTTSRLHNDNFENIYIQVSGSKEIYLIPPGDAYALDEKFLKPLSYDSKMKLKDDFTEAFGISKEQASCANNNGLNNNNKNNNNNNDMDGDTQMEDMNKFASMFQAPNILFPTIDPSNPATFNSIYCRNAFVYRVVLNPGDMLYIPALWYHQVRVLDGAPNVSLNYWYQPSATNGQWMRWDYVRYCSAVLRGYHDPYYFDDQDEEKEVQALLKIQKEYEYQLVHQQQQQQKHHHHKQQQQQKLKQQKQHKHHHHHNNLQSAGTSPTTTTSSTSSSISSLSSNSFTTIEEDEPQQLLPQLK